MERTLLVTNDGSHTVTIPSLEITYHSRHGAIGESTHVFINAGLKKSWELCNEISSGTSGKLINLLEVGFGTGLNVLLTCLECIKAGRKVFYTTIEPFPLGHDLVMNLNYPKLLSNEWEHEPIHTGVVDPANLNSPADGSILTALDDPDHANEPTTIFRQIHGAAWNVPMDINPFFKILKVDVALLNFANKDTYDLVFFDAFAPSADPEIWSQESMQKVFSMLRPGAILTTYCSKSIVRKHMQAAGFRIEKIPGPWGKREMVRAYK